MKRYIITLSCLTLFFMVGCSLKGTEDDASISDMLAPNISYLRAHVSGGITNAAGTAIVKKDIEVFLGSKAIKRSWDTHYYYTPMQKAYTDESGKYHFYNVIPGRYSLYAVDRSSNPVLSGTLEIELREGDSEMVNIPIDNTKAVVMGKVTDSGSPRSNMNVILRSSGSDLDYNSVWTNSKGEFCFVVTPTAAPIDIIVKDSGEITFSQRDNIALTAGTDTEFSLVSTLQTASNHYVLKGTVKDGKTNKTIENATLKISQGPDSFYSISKTDGSYEFDFYSSNNASYNLEVDKTGFRTYTKVVQFGDSKEITLDVPLAYNLADGYFNIVGTAYNLAGNLYTGQTVELKAYDTDEVTIENLLYTYKTETDNNGNFVFTDITRTNISGRDSFFYVWLENKDRSTVEVSVSGSDLTYVVELREE